MTRLALHFLFFLSGAAALGYQLVWTKLFATGLGHEYPAMLAIVCAFVPVAFWLRGSSFYRVGVLKAGSLAVAVLAGWWMIERMFDLAPAA